MDLRKDFCRKECYLDIEVCDGVDLKDDQEILLFKKCFYYSIQKWSLYFYSLIYLYESLNEIFFVLNNQGRQPSFKYIIRYTIEIKSSLLVGAVLIREKFFTKSTYMINAAEREIPIKIGVLLQRFMFPISIQEAVRSTEVYQCEYRGKGRRGITRVKQNIVWFNIIVANA